MRSILRAGSGVELVIASEIEVSVAVGDWKENLICGPTPATRDRIRRAGAAPLSPVTCCDSRRRRCAFFREIQEMPNPSVRRYRPILGVG
jgi:hypothetical protein